MKISSDTQLGKTLKGANGKLFAICNQIEVIDDDENITYSADAIEINNIDEVDEAIVFNDENRKYLRDTDWYVTRFAETGVAIPKDVLAKREEARELL